MFKKRRRDADSQIVRKLIVIRFLVLALIPHVIVILTVVALIVSIIAIYIISGLCAFCEQYL